MLEAITKLPGAPVIEILIILALFGILVFLEWIDTKWQ